MVQAFSYWTDYKLEIKTSVRIRMKGISHSELNHSPKTCFWNHLEIKFIVSTWVHRIYSSTQMKHVVAQSLPISSLLILLWLLFSPVQPFPSGLFRGFLTGHRVVSGPSAMPILLILHCEKHCPHLLFFFSLPSCQLFLSNSETIADRFLCCSTSTWPRLLLNNSFNHHLLTHGTLQHGGLAWASFQV